METVRQRSNQSCQFHHLRGFFEFLFRSAVPHKQQVGGDRTIEQNRIAREIAYALTQALEMNIPNVFAAQAYCARNRVIKPGDEPDKRALAGAVFSRNRDVFSRPNAKRRYAEQISIPGVSELDCGELDVRPVFLGKDETCLGICHGRAQGKRGLHLADTGESLLCPGIEFGGAAEWVKQLRHETVESN